MSDGTSDACPEFIRFQIPFPPTDFRLGRDASGFVGLHATFQHESGRGLDEKILDALAPGLLHRGHDVESELLLGKHPTNRFIGVMARTEAGQVYLGAGGFVSSGSFEVGSKIATTVSLVISGALLGARAYLTLSTWSTSPFANFIEATLRGLLFGYNTYEAIATSGVSKSPGKTLVYGDDSVKVAGLKAVSIVSPGIAGLSGGASAAISSTLSASVSSLLVASVRGVYGTTVAGGKVVLRARSEMTLSTVEGRVDIEGRLVRLGRRGRVKRGGGVGRNVRPRGLLDTAQEATQEVAIEADARLHLAAGAVLEGSEARIALEPHRIVSSTRSGAAVTVRDCGALPVVDVSAGRSAIRVDDDGVTIALLETNVSEACEDDAFDAREDRIEAVDKATEAAEAANKLTATIAGGGIFGSLAAGGILNGLTRGSIPALESPAAAIAGVGVGAVGLTAAAAAAGLRLAKASKTRLAAELKAEQTFDEQVERAFDVRDQTLARELAAPNPRPKIRLTEDAIELAIGETKLVLTKDGIELHGATLVLKGTEAVLVTSEDALAIEAGSPVEIKPGVAVE